MIEESVLSGYHQRNVIIADDTAFITDISTIVDEVIKYT